MEKIAFIVERLNAPPFSKGIATMTEVDSRSSAELLDLLSEVIVAIDPDQEPIKKEPAENKVARIFHFLSIMKFNVPEGHQEDFQSMLSNGDKEILLSVIHWCLTKFEHLQKRAYLAKYLLPIDIPPEFLGDDLVIELSGRLRDLQQQFKDVHKEVEQVRSTGVRPADLKAEINQLELERGQLQAKIQKLKKEKDALDDDAYFEEILKATSSLRKEQEEEAKIHERLRENRAAFQEAELRFSDAARRLNEARSGRNQDQTAEEILVKLQKEVKDLVARRETLENAISERSNYLERLQNWDVTMDRVMTEQDVREKRAQVQETEDAVSSYQERLDAAMERNPKLAVFRQASAMALKQLREKEEEMDKLNEEKRRLGRQIDEKEAALRAAGKASSRSSGKMDFNKYAAIVRDKIEKYKKMRDELSSLRNELVLLQRTEQILKSRHKNLDDFLADLEKRQGVEGYRDTQRELIEMTEKTAEIDQLKGNTLEQISQMVEQIGREFKSKQTQLQPLMAELKSVRHEFMDVEAQFAERKSSYDKIAVGLEIEKQTLEKDCDTYQEESLREESRYHYLHTLITMANHKLERAELESKYQRGEQRMMRDFGSLKDLFTHKLTLQEQMIKQLRKQQKELKESSGAMTNQKSIFRSLQKLLAAKLECSRESFLDGGAAPGKSRSSAGGDVLSF